MKVFPRSTFRRLALVLMCCASVADAASGQFLVTVLRSSDPVEVGLLLGAQHTTETASASRQRVRRTATDGREGHERWQLVVTEGEVAHMASTEPAWGLQVPWVELTRHGPLPHVAPELHERMHGIGVEVRRVGREVEVRLEQFADGPAGTVPVTGLSTVVRGVPGRWLDVGGNLMPESTPSGLRRYGTRGGDPRRYRLLMKVDLLN